MTFLEKLHVITPLPQLSLVRYMTTTFTVDISLIYSFLYLFILNLYLSYYFSASNKTTVSAVEIASALKNASFSRRDEYIIKKAYNQYMKGKVCKRKNKKRKLKEFIKRYHRKSEEDSGEQGSNSSISSDDCRSTRSEFPIKNMHYLMMNKSVMRKPIPKENAYKNMVQTTNANYAHNEKQNINTNLKDCNKENARIRNNDKLISCSKNTLMSIERDKTPDNNNIHDDIFLTHKSNGKVCTNIENRKSLTSKVDHQNERNKDTEFMFAKPQIPVRIVKQKSCLINDMPQCKTQNNDEEFSEASISTNNLTKSSFMRRKLFTQTLDVTESKQNMSTDNVTPESPLSNIYKSTLGDKNKSNKKSLLPKSCLTRNIVQEKRKSEHTDVIELVQKIVPSEHLNVNSINSSHVKEKETRPSEPNENLDICSIISTGNHSVLSDTFTDEEEIFNRRNIDSEMDLQQKINDKLLLPCNVLLPKTNYFKVNLNTFQSNNISTKHINENISAKNHQTKNCNTDFNAIDDISIIKKRFKNNSSKIGNYYIQKIVN